MRRLRPPGSGIVHPRLLVETSRRGFLRRTFGAAGWIAVGGSLARCGDGASPPPAPGGSGGSGPGGAPGVGGSGGAGGGTAPSSNLAHLGALGPPDDHGLRLPRGFTSRIVAQSGAAVGPSDHIWHGAPDGGAVFSAGDGWIYVSNSELNGGAGGAGAIRFSGAGEIIDAYAILGETSRNCGGGVTPWGTWLSCEEIASGEVWECDPTGARPAIVRPSLGVFNHEAAAVDPVGQQLYLTEDEPDGRLYRFTPDRYPDLSQGTMEVLRVLSGDEGATEWLPLADPIAGETPTRLQVPESTPFTGGEGIWHHQGIVYFATKGDDRVWAFEVATGLLSILYDRATSASPILSGVDNVTVSPAGDVLVAEDGGDMEIVALTPDGAIAPIVQVVGHDDSEICGPAFDPSLTRLYFSSQRGTTGNTSDGVTFEVSGPFFG